jgi:hypothetical protein
MPSPVVHRQRPAGDRQAQHGRDVGRRGLRSSAAPQAPTADACAVVGLVTTNRALVASHLHVVAARAACSAVWTVAAMSSIVMAAEKSRPAIFRLRPSIRMSKPPSSDQRRSIATTALTVKPRR